MGVVAEGFPEPESLCCAALFGALVSPPGIRRSTGLVNFGKVAKKLTPGFQKPIEGQDCL